LRHNLGNKQKQTPQQSQHNQQLYNRRPQAKTASVNCCLDKMSSNIRDSIKIGRMAKSIDDS